MAAALVAAAFTTATLRAADTGIPVPAGTWTLGLTKGLPVEANGWEQLVYAPVIKQSVMFSQYHQRNSEPNESMLGYSFDLNAWTVLDMGGNFHTETMPEGGESQGYFDFNPNNNTIIYHCCTTGSNQPENANHTWWYDVLGQSGRDKHTSPKPPAPALQPGGAFDPAHNVFIFHGGDSFVGTWTYDPVANNWLKMSPTGTLPDPSLILAGVAYSSATQKMYLVGGLSSAGYNADLYSYDYPTNSWTLITPSNGIKPPGRYRHAFAYDSTNNIFLMYGGQNASGMLNDTWIFDPSANTWTQLNPSQAPPVPGTAVFAKLSYDSDHNAFVLAQAGTGGYYGGIWSAYAVQTWLFRYKGSGPNAGTASSTAAPAGGSLNRNTSSWGKDPVLASSGNTLYVAWSEVGAPFDLSDAAWPHIYVSQYSGGSWTPLGASFQSVSSTAIKEAHAPSMAIVGGTPWASWYESDNAGHTAQVYAKSWDGASTWNGGAVGLNGGGSPLYQGQSQITDVGGTAHVAVLEVDKSVFPQRTLAYVKSWDGTGWSLKGGALNKSRTAGNTALSVSIASDGVNPYAAWSEYLHVANNGSGYDNDTNPNIYVSVWNGSQWTALGGSLNVDPANWAYDPSISILNGQPYVAWTERTRAGNAQLYVKTWNGSAWSLVGQGALNRAPGAGWAYHPSLSVDAASNTLYIAWVEQLSLGQKAQAFVSKLAAGSWSAIGGSLNADPLQGSAQRVSLGVYGGQPVAAWGEVNLGSVRQIYVKQWNGSTWTQLSGLGGPRDITPPSTPSGITAVGVSSSQVNVGWGPSSDTVGVTGYAVFRGGVQIATVTSTLTYTDTGLSPSTTYTYTLRAFDAAGNLSASSGSANATTFGAGTGTGGALTGSLAFPSGTVQLTTEGSSDWAHWGLTSAGSFNHKANVGQQISNYTTIGGPASQFSNNPVAFAWTDGIPTASTTTNAGVFVAGQSQGFRITVPADTTARTLRVYVGVYRTQALMTAHLSDGSAPDYSDSSLSNNSGLMTPGVYTFAYSAPTAGQTLTVTFTQFSPAGGNVTLEAATLAGGTVTPDFVVSAAPATQSVAAGNSIGYTVSVSSLNGFAGSVGFAATGLPSGVAASFNPANTNGGGSVTMTVSTTSAVTPGTYPFTVTATGGSTTHTAGATLAVTAAPIGGSLTGALSSPTGPAQLTTEGTADWAHWGLTTAADFNHKAAVAQQISNYAVIGGAAVSRYTNNGIGFTWTDGTPTASATNSTTGIFVAGQNKGFQITVPADKSARTLRLYVGAWHTQARITAHLSDGSAADYIDTALTNSVSPTTLGVYTLTYQAASAGQTLTVTYTQNTSTSGNIALQAATLSGGAPVPDFSLSATPSTQTVNIGDSPGYTVSVSPLNGFAADVSFAASGLPAGVTAGFSPATVTGSGSTTLTLTTSSNTPPGSYPVTITATSGTLTHTASVTLAVNGPPDFTFSASPSSRTTAAGGNAAYTATVTAVSNFAGTVSFNVTGLPTGITASFNPATVTGSGSPALTLTVASTTAAGTYPLTVTATSGAIVHTASIGLTVTDFSISATPASKTATAGASAGYSVTISALSGFTGSTGFTVTGLPQGASATFSPTTVTGGGSSTLTVATTAATAPGSYPLTVTATSGSLSHTVPITFNVTVAASGGTLSGSAATPTGPVQLTTEGTSDWAHWGLNTKTDFDHKAAGAQQISNYTALGTGAAARYANNGIGFTWTDGTPTGTASNSTTGVFTPGQNSGFSLTAPADTNVRTLRVYVGAWRAQALMIAHLSDGSAPDYTDATLTNNAGVTTLRVYTFTYSAAASGQTLTIMFTQSASTVTGTTGNVALQAATLAGGNAAPDFTISATQSSQTVTAGSNTSYSVNISGVNGFTGTAGLSVTGAPTGVTAVFNPTSVTGSGSSTLSVSTAAALAAGTYPLTITATSGVLAHSTGVTLVVTAPAGGGSLSGALSTPTGGIQLTTEGTSDWAHWGLTAAADYNHKANVTPQISTITLAAGGTITRYSNNGIGFTWTDGAPTPSASNSTTGVFVSGLNNGFRFTVPADTTSRTLRVYVGAWHTQGRIVAHLSDGSAADYVDTSLVNSVSPTSLGIYTITYAAASAGQTLTLTFTQTNGNGNVAIQAATLQ